MTNYTKLIREHSNSVQEMSEAQLQDLFMTMISDPHTFQAAANLLKSAAVECLEKHVLAAHKHELMSGGESERSSSDKQIEEYRRQGAIKAIKLGHVMESISIHYEAAKFAKNYHANK